MLDRSKRVHSYDARFADGRVNQCVDVDKVPQGARLPADNWVNRKSSDSACEDRCRRLGRARHRGSAARWTARLTMVPRRSGPPGGASFRRKPGAAIAALFTGTAELRVAQRLLPL